MFPLLLLGILLMGCNCQEDGPNLLMFPLLLLGMLLVGCNCNNDGPKYLDQPTEEPPSFRPLWLIVKSYLAVMIIIVFAIIILFMVQGHLVKIFGSLARCCLKLASVKERLVRKNAEEDKDAENVKDENGNECINEQRFCKVSTLRMIDDETPRMSFSIRQSEYQSFAPVPATFSRADNPESEFSAALIASIKNRHGEPTPV